MTKFDAGIDEEYIRYPDDITAAGLGEKHFSERAAVRTLEKVESIQGSIIVPVHDLISGDVIGEIQSDLNTSEEALILLIQNLKDDLLFAESGFIKSCVRFVDVPRAQGLRDRGHVMRIMRRNLSQLIDAIAQAEEIPNTSYTKVTSAGEKQKLQELIRMIGELVKYDKE